MSEYPDVRIYGRLVRLFRVRLCRVRLRRVRDPPWLGPLPLIW